MTINEIRVTVSQAVDSNQSPNDICQTLVISAEDSGGGPYMVLSTERWAMDDATQLERLWDDILTLWCNHNPEETK